MFHISDIKKFVRCRRLYFYSKDEPSTFQPYLRSDESIFDLLIDYFKIDRYFLGIKNDSVDHFLSEQNNYQWFLHTRFIDDDLRINIPLMRKDDDGYVLFFIYYGTLIKDIDLFTYKICMSVVSKYNLNVKDINIIYFNGEYINDGVLNPNELFITINVFKEKTILELTNKFAVDYISIINEMKTNSLDTIESKKCKYCRQNGLCDYYQKCFDEAISLPDDSILSLVTSQYKEQMYDEGIQYLKDVDLNRLEGNRVQYAQIQADKNGGIFLDKLAMEKWLEPLNVRPISFIDFEWDRYLVPPYKAMKPLDVLCFEFALYYIDENGNMEHKTYVGTKDCREDFIKNLIKQVPNKGPILAYNAYGAECLRLVELADMYPEYSEELLSIKDRFIDLAEPFCDGLIYDVRMNGNYTLKKLVDICSNYSYKYLDIYDGMSAVYNWRDIDKGESDNDEKIVDELKQYCSLDAYGLFLVYKWILQIMVKSNQ